MRGIFEPQTGPTHPNHEAELIRLQSECNRIQNLYLRTLADLDNLRKRTLQDQSKADRAGKRNILLRVLEVVDNFERALEQTSGLPGPLVEGFQVIHRQLLNLLNVEGVTPMTTLGQEFDPSLHEAVAAIGDNNQNSGTIVAELSRGYRWQDELLRPAKVSVFR